jgi:peptide/nickel transport system substrate-binding protein
MRAMRPRQLILGVLAAATLVLPALVLPATLPASGQQSNATTSSAPGTPSGLAFRVGVLHDVESLAVAKDPTPLAREVLAIQYPGLTQYATDDLAPAPGLADAWTPSPDGRSYTFHLRDGLEWSDGERVTPADVVTSIDRARDEHWPGLGRSLAGITAKASGQQGVVVTSATLDQTLPIINVPIVPQHAANALTVGSGPYVVTKRQAGFVRMIANDRYWGGRPPFDAIEFHVYKDGAALVNGLKRDEVDAVSGVPPQLFDELNADAHISTLFGNDGEYYALALDTRSKPFDDVRVRQALWFSIDRALLIEHVRNGVGRSAVLPTVARSPGWGFEQRSIEQLEQQYDDDPRAARALLKAAGVDKVAIAIDVPKGDAEAAKAFSALRDVLGSTAFSVTGGSATTPANARLVLRTPADDPSVVLREFTCTDGAFWCDRAFDAQYRQESTDLDPESRLQTVRAMQRTLLAQAPEVPLYHPDVLEGFRSDMWTGVTRQPRATGPAFSSLTAPTFLSIKQAPQFGSDKLSSTVLMLVIVTIVVVTIVAVALYFVVRARGGLQTPPPASPDPDPEPAAAS